MKIKLLAIGKTDSKALVELIADYQHRISRHISFEFEIVPDIKNAKNLSEAELKKKEAEGILAKINRGETVVVLDEKGKEYNSVAFAKYLQQFMNAGIRQLVFVVGGPYGVDAKVHKRALASWSLSQLTFSHQMVRLFAIEQIYRAMTILKNLPYHHH